MIYNKLMTLPSCDINVKLHAIEGCFQISSQNTYTNLPIKSGFLITKCLSSDLTENLQYAVNSDGIFYRKLTNAYGFTIYDGVLTNSTWNQFLVGNQAFGANIQFASAATSTIGSASAPAKDLYLQNAVTVVSDRNYKSNIQDVPDAVIDVWGTLNFQMYQLNTAIDVKGDKDARFHIGLIAQDIVAAFEKAGIDWRLYGIVIHEQWDAIAATDYIAATFDEEGKQLTPEVQAVAARAAGEIYMVRYDECMALESLYQRKKIAAQDLRIAALEAKLKS